ncbi:MAG: diaminopimelate epimerase [Armatimonadetes bacterium JP3_11]|nr:MAG: diaminopimelate epimerase [Armatimonadetes bacterium CP1_7O]OYT74604.1 MAG: diaminopimelate epimerase [Armatimonadetes bacterium JP3_11]RMH07082.1 MAG: diaminopimelate epimerase [Armatimonadota bacterium]
MVLPDELPSRIPISRSSSLRFFKLQGAGNDFVLLDCLQQPLPRASEASLARRLCDRRLGVGGDGLLLVEPSQVADYQMRILNADGSEATMCGNGIRCFARYLWETYSLATDCLTIETGAGIRRVYRGQGNLLTVEMGSPRLLVLSRPPTLEAYALSDTELLAFHAVHTGAPHLVLLVRDVAQFPLEAVGPALEHHPDFPDRTNVSVAQVESRAQARARVWERGAGATQACGTGACAIVVAGALQGLLGRKATVRMPGGDLQVEWREDDTLWLTGDATLVFEGVWRDDAPIE